MDHCDTMLFLFLFLLLDGKTYDVFLMCYKSGKVPGLKQCDVRWLENVLEDNLGYKLCLFDRDVHPGKGIVFHFHNLSQIPFS